MKMFVVLALAAFAAAEPEADPQLLLGGINGVHSSYTPYSHVAPVSTYASPLWSNMVPAGIQYPMTYGSQYPMTYGAQYPMTHAVFAEPTKVVTNYLNRDQYTAEATPLGKALGIPSYTAKNGKVVHEVQKREAEADPGLIHSGLMHTPYAGINTAYAAGMISPYTRMMTHHPMMTYNAIKPMVTKTFVSSYMSPYWGMTGMSHMIHKREAEAEADPALLYSGMMHTPYAGINTAYTAGMMSPYTRMMTHRPMMTYNTIKPIVTKPVVSSYMSPYWGMTGMSHMIHKREAEAEADPALLYSGLMHTPYAGINTAYTAGMMSPYTRMMTHLPMMTYNAIKPIITKPFVDPITYGISPVNTVYKTKDHGVVATHAGLIHSSLTGMCLNNEGVQVSC